uniref:Uncharacterized protein n=1 Tax=Candidatus Kentrum sp. TC TaxID=2126339 RepID=A0A450YCK3_9GAMM|nr:MAG: hypothetical protein BECKTC1821E_GA0114239_100471 [Candidatus Kentron sp. TC]
MTDHPLLTLDALSPTLGEAASDHFFGGVWGGAFVMIRKENSTRRSLGKGYRRAWARAMGRASVYAGWLGSRAWKRRTASAPGGNGAACSRGGRPEPSRATARANIPGVQAGASSSMTISESFMVRSRSMSVREAGEVEVSFISGGLSYGNDSIVAIARGVGHGNHLSLQQSEGEKARFAVFVAVVFGGQRVPGEDDFCVDEVDAVFRNVCPAFLLMPNEHGKILALSEPKVIPISGNMARSPCPATGNRISHATS